MKQVFTSPYLTECDLLRMDLSSVNIEAEIRNEFGQAVGLNLGIGGAAAFIWPEVWVRDDDFENAVDVVRGRKVANDSSIAVTAPPWICPHCRESIDGQMTACWNCETEKPIPA